ncbi:MULTISPECIES: hypothetical protein [unclassified Halomonas]|uniref:hypothetical protein n=1 Tax=unclassified Halomonas TaxID=2609666 RepID=UPI001C9710BA|nr:MULTISPECIES: hypothetical protein [unclassified Halomonas]MBY5926310.1 hypothetical protein [Halomonas sp. DP4Y7-2]MBY6233352.1 hypothetical protein [Halomonas sp. DP4Y7-1]
MITVALDLNCSICGHSRFTIPVGRDDGDSVHCANCTAYKCKAMDLERALMATTPPPPQPMPSPAAAMA